jgi:hypothetical protein
MASLKWTYNKALPSILTEGKTGVLSSVISKFDTNHWKIGEVQVGRGETKTTEVFSFFLAIIVKSIEEDPLGRIYFGNCP